MKNVSHYKHIVSKFLSYLSLKWNNFFVLYYESDFTVIPFDSLLWRGIFQASPENFWKIFAKMVQS